MRRRDRIRGHSRAGQGREGGFTLLELMIVVAVIAIVAAMAIPSLLNARMAANESSTIATLRTVSTVQEQYRLRFRSFAGALADLQTAGYMDSSANSTGTKSGYTYTYVGGTNTFALNADPTNPGSSGSRFFFVDLSGVIRFETAATATSASQPVDD